MINILTTCDVQEYDKLNQTKYVRGASVGKTKRLAHMAKTWCVSARNDDGTISKQVNR